MKLSEIRIRDPFIVCDEENKKYYLFGTTDENTWSGRAVGLNCYISNDLENWSDSVAAFRPAKNFWADENFWAPEVFRLDKMWYMAASFKAKGKCRGVHLLSSINPAGPYQPVIDSPVTPEEWDCLDGTVFLEKDIPWLVFSHEWQQVRDGEICAMSLSRDLRKATGEPALLFTASQAPWVIAGTGSVSSAGNCFVTDGPFLFWGKDKNLHMLWSSYTKSGYGIGIAHSQTNTVLGPWTHEKKPLYEKNGGHGMLFKTLEGITRLIIHAPNDYPMERVKFIDISNIV